jgi:hypothetical protein
MTYVITSENPINPIAAPRLPNAPTEYEQRYLDSLNSILRLYFNQLDNTIRQLQATEILSEATVIDGGLPSQAYDSVTDNAELTPSGFFNGGTP